MTLEDIIESINEYIADRRKELDVTNHQYLVLQRTITPDSTFKAYKQYEFIVWVVGGKDQYRLFTLSHQANVSANFEEALIHNLEMQFVTKLLSCLIEDKSFSNKDRTLLEDIVYGEYINH